MNDLLQMSFFSLLSENSQEIRNREMQTAYEEFVKRVESLNQFDGDYASRISRAYPTMKKGSESYIISKRTNQEDEYQR